MPTSSFKKFFAVFKDPSVANSLLVFLVCLILFSLFSASLLTLFFLKIAPKETISVITSQFSVIYIIINDLLFIGLSLIFLRRFASLCPRDLGVTWSIGKNGLKNDLLFAVLVTFFLCILYIILCNLENFFFGITEEKKTNALLLSGIINPYGEEFLFRGVLSALLLRHHIRWRTIIILSALIFGPTHLVSPEYLVSHAIAATLLGFYFAWVYYKTRSLILPAILHTMVNALNLLLRLYPGLRSQLEVLFIWV